MNDERGIQCPGAWSDDGRYALCFLHGFACQRLTGWPNRLRLDVGGGRRPVKRRAKPTRSTAELTGSWRLFRSVLVHVESTGCQQHPQLAWPPTNSCSEPVCWGATFRRVGMFLELLCFPQRILGEGLGKFSDFQECTDTAIVALEIVTLALHWENEMIEARQAHFGLPGYLEGPMSIRLSAHICAQFAQRCRTVPCSSRPLPSVGLTGAHRHVKFFLRVPKLRGGPSGSAA